MIILGLNVYHGDASAAIIVDGKLLAAAEEERFNRIKHCAGFPKEAVKYCLKQAGISVKELDYIAVPRNPRARFIKKAYYGLKIPALALKRFSLLHRMQGIKKTLAEIFEIDQKQVSARVLNVEHHRAHIASSFFVSSFDKAVLFSSDGLGDFASTMWGIGEGNKIKILGEIAFPHSLGIYYTAITQYLGFTNYGDEYKVMGLASYGQPEYKDEFRKILMNDRVLNFALGLDYFIHHQKMVEMNFEEGYPYLDLVYASYLEKRLGSHRQSECSIEERHQNIAATLQSRLEEVIFSLLKGISKLSELKNLCMAGGVALNCVVNGKLFDNTIFKKIYIPPAAGDAGLAIGAAYYVWNQILDRPRDFTMEHVYWGPEYDSKVISYELGVMRDELNKQDCKVDKIEDEDELCKETAAAIADGKIVGWFQDRMEWGPRTLGNRSILADPRKPGMKDILNSRIKHRESFRPFAPSILEEEAGDYFETFQSSPFMLFTYRVKKEKAKLIPAVVHIDGTARIQTVDKVRSPLYWKLIKEFKNLTGIPILLNTSFNENEPIVCNPRDAIECFLRTKIEVLVIGNYWIEKGWKEEKNLSL